MAGGDVGWACDELARAGGGAARAAAMLGTACAGWGLPRGKIISSRGNLAPSNHGTLPLEDEETGKAASQAMHGVFTGPAGVWRYRNPQGMKKRSAWHAGASI